uniref:Ig-like domain-containing protein n=1 Tax=uncultured Methanobrevibacter sp. TaxID=253161 RepID=UPI0026219E0A
NATGIEVPDWVSDLFNGTEFDLSGLLNATGIEVPDWVSDLFNGTGFDLSGLLNATGIKIPDWISNLLNGTVISNITDFNVSKIIKDLIGGETPKDSITSADLTKYYTQNTGFKVTVKNGDTPLTKGKVIFTVDNKEYVGSIGSDGVASVTLKNLKPGTHYITSEYGQTLVKNKITVKKSIITKNVSKKYKKAGKFTVKLLNSKGKAFAKQTVKIKFKGKTYKVKTNSKGIATFKLAKNLKVGKYTIKTTYAGLTLSNKITVKK